MFTYAQAETLLARLHAADGVVRTKAFRGRLKHLQRLGLPLGRPPGRGNKTPYTRDQLYQWAFCLECAQFGFDPTWMAKQVEKHWPSIYEGFRAAERSDGPGSSDVFLWITPNMMTEAWNEDRIGKKQIGPLWFTYLPKRKLRERLEKVDGKFRRVCLLNLSGLVRGIGDIEQEIRVERS
jgi:hypothetical protein